MILKALALLAFLSIYTLALSGGLAGNLTLVYLSMPALAAYALIMALISWRQFGRCYVTVAITVFIVLGIINYLMQEPNDPLATVGSAIVMAAWVFGYATLRKYLGIKRDLFKALLVGSPVLLGNAISEYIVRGRILGFAIDNPITVMNVVLPIAVWLLACGLQVILFKSLSP